MLLCHSSVIASIYKEYSMFRSIFLACCFLSVTACSNFQFSSNLDKENFHEYFKPSTVTVYEKNELLKLEYDVIAAVEGSSCQEKKMDRPADIKQARTRARINAAELNANGIVFQTCLSFPQDQSCVTNIICYGRALDVKFPDDE